MKEVEIAYAAFKTRMTQNNGTNLLGLRPWNKAGYVTAAAVAVTSVVALLAAGHSPTVDQSAPDNYACTAPNTGIVNRMSAAEARARLNAAATDVCVPSTAQKTTEILMCKRTDDGVQTRIELTTSSAPGLVPIRDRTLHTLVREKFLCAYELSGS